MIQINLIEYFQRTVENVPDKIAVIEGENVIDFLTLERCSLIMADFLIKSIGDTNKPVAVLLPKSIGSIVSNIAITYSGNVYMNLDTKSPEARIGNILSLIAPPVIITDSASIVRLEQIGYSGIVINIDLFNFDHDINKSDIFNTLNEIIDTDPYCIINTSGSTGTPKGVVLNHKSFIDFTEWAIDTLEIGDNEIIGSLSPLVFDIYSFELCLMMSKANTIVLIPENLSPFPIKIIELLQVHAVSFIFWVPTIMVNIANMDLLNTNPLPLLKSVWFAGEVFPTKQFNYWQKHLRDTKFVNLYGPIEITLDCTYFIVESPLNDNEPIPIGFPCKNTDVLILNDDNQLARIDEIGELCVRGTSLALGYYNNPEKTSLAFVQNPLNKSYPEVIYRTGDLVYKNQKGEIIFKGRKDSLIKHLGYRIELGEIEHVIINSLKLVDNGCVVYNFSKKEITLFYESRSETPVSEMRRAIGSIFPKYMIPTRFERLDQLPRNSNGKIDRLYFNQLANG